MGDILVELIRQNPTAFPVLFIILVAAAAWHMGMTYNTFHYMKTSMVTKKDLAIALLTHERELDSRYVRRAE